MMWSEAMDLAWAKGRNIQGTDRADKLNGGDNDDSQDPVDVDSDGVMNTYNIKYGNINNVGDNSDGFTDTDNIINNNSKSKTTTATTERR